MHTIETINYIIMCLFFVAMPTSSRIFRWRGCLHENGKHRNRIRITHLQF